jgi:hypothetical protein
MKFLKQFMRHPPVPEGRARALMATSLVGFGVALALVAIPGLAADKIMPETVTWGLTKTVVVDPGTTSITAEGTLVQGYTIESKAKEKDSKLVPEGTFRLELSAFQPTGDMDGQEAGLWYVQGRWSVIDKYTLDDVKHSRGVVSGFVKTVLDFDPTQTPGGWTAPAQLPMSTVTAVSTDGIQWGRGSGTYTLDSALDGTLHVDLSLWPVVQTQ